jgi:CRP-like cAMP-binding protein
MLQSNAILASLSASDISALRPHLKATHLQQKTVLYEAGDLINAVYFLISACVSLVVTLATGEMTETAMVGKDGAIGLASALDGKVAMSRAIVQLGGDAMVCDPTAFRGAALQSESLISKVMRHEQTLFAQAQQSTACMANHEVDARLCRWLLRARDLSGSDQLPFTQEFLAEMLGVRRTSGGSHDGSTKPSLRLCKRGSIGARPRCESAAKPWSIPSARLSLGWEPRTSR